MIIEGVFVCFFVGSVFNLVRGVQRKPLSVFAVFQGPTAQNN